MASAAIKQAKGDVRQTQGLTSRILKDQECILGECILGECILEANEDCEDCRSTSSSISLTCDGTTSVEEDSEITSSDSTSGGNDSRMYMADYGDRLRICEVCGDEVEQEGHKVCFWHALTLKTNDSQSPKYKEEAEYALSRYFKDIGSYLKRTSQKKTILFQSA